MADSKVDRMSLRVLHVLNDLSHGGAESFVFSLLEEANSNGLAFGVMLLHRNDGIANQQRIKALKSDSIGVYQLKGFLSLLRAIRDFKPDVIHCHNLKSLLVCLFVKMSILGRVKLVFTQHTSYLKRKHFHKVVFRFVDAYCAICEVARRDFESIIPPGKIFLAKNGIKDGVNENVSLRSDGKCNVGMIARFHPIKNHDLLIDAAGFLKDINQIDYFKFILVGDGECKEYAEAKVKELGCEEAFYFTGSKENARQYIAGFDYLILCSKNEGFPITILEALQMEKPVIATKVGGVPDLVKDGLNGFLIESDDAELLARTLLKAKSREVQSRFRDYYEKHDFDFTVGASLKNHLEIYESLIKS